MVVKDLHNIVHFIADFIHYTIHCIVYINDVFMYSISHVISHGHRPIPLVKIQKTKLRQLSIIFDFRVPGGQPASGYHVTSQHVALS